MINLFTTYYDEKNDLRNWELVSCIKKNIDNPFIEKLYILNESPFVFLSSKFVSIKVQHRPTFNEFFEIINQKTQYEDINIIANTDIYFNDSIRLLYKIPHFEKKCIALAKWDYINSKKLRFNQNDYSQDAWIFKGKIRKINGNYLLGTMGCDNKIAYEVHNAGYKLLNPSLSIIAVHLHLSPIRNYNKNEQISPPHKYILPTVLGNKNAAFIKSCPHNDYKSLLIKKYYIAFYIRPIVRLLIKIFNHLNKETAVNLKRYYYRRLI